MIAAAALAALGAYGAIKGAPTVAKRALGGEEHIGPPQRDDERWQFRGYGTHDITELTQTPVRITNTASTTPPVKAEWDVVVVGGAAAGLATAASLHRRGVQRVLVVEKNENVGDVWRSRYHRLHLHDIAEECSLPGFALPSDFPRFPTREQFASYLEAYALCHRLEVKYLTVVSSVKENNGKNTGNGKGRWAVTLRDVSSEAATDTQTVYCQHVVLANGIYNDPMVPALPSLPAYTGQQIHSCRYTNGTELGLQGKRVLVVGFGNSAAEIAIDLVEHGAARPTVLVRSETTVVPRWAVQRFQETLHTHLLPLAVGVPFGWLAVGLAAVLVVDPAAYAVQQWQWGGRAGLAELGLPLSWKRPVARAVLDQEPPVMDVGTIECARRGLLRIQQGEIDTMDGLRVKLKGQDANAEAEEYDCIVWATGYNMFQGHRHFFEGELLERVGLGVQALLDIKAAPGTQHPRVPGLWLNFGRIQMLSQGAQHLAWGIAGELGASGGENDLVDAKDSWPVFVGKHAAVAAVAVGVSRYMNRSRL